MRVLWTVVCNRRPDSGVSVPSRVIVRTRVMWQAPLQYYPHLNRTERQIAVPGGLYSAQCAGLSFCCINITSTFLEVIFRCAKESQPELAIPLARRPLGALVHFPPGGSMRLGPCHTTKGRQECSCHCGAGHSTGSRGDAHLQRPRVQLSLVGDVAADQPFHEAGRGPCQDGQRKGVEAPRTTESNVIGSSDLRGAGSPCLPHNLPPAALTQTCISSRRLRPWQYMDHTKLAMSLCGRSK